MLQAQFKLNWGLVLGFLMLPIQDNSVHATLLTHYTHFKPFCFRIGFKILPFVFKALKGLGPSYLPDFLFNLWSLLNFQVLCSWDLLIIPKFRTKPTVRHPITTMAHISGTTFVNTWGQNRFWFYSLKMHQFVSKNITQNDAFKKDRFLR